MKNNSFSKRNRTMLVSLLAGLSSMSSGNLVLAREVPMGSYYPQTSVTMQPSVPIQTCTMAAPQSQIMTQPVTQKSGDSISQVLVAEQVAKNQKSERKDGLLGWGDLAFEVANIGGNFVWYKFANTLDEKLFFEYFVNPFKISDNDPTKNETKTLTEWGLNMNHIKETINELTDSDDLFVLAWRERHPPLRGITTKRSSLIVEDGTNDLNKEPDDSRIQIGQPDPITGETMQADDDVLISAYCPSRLKTMKFTKMQSEIFKVGFKNYCFSNETIDPIILGLALGVGHLVSIPVRAVWHVGSKVGTSVADVARLQASK